MGGMSLWHWLVVGIVVMLLFGRGKISEMMGDVAKGIKAFKKGMAEDDTATVAPGQTVPGEPAKTLEHQTPGGGPAATAGVTAPMGERKIG